MVADQSAISGRSVEERAATDWRSVGDWLATVSWAFVFDCRKSASFFRSVGNRSVISRRLKTVSGLSTTAATGRISRQPVGNLSATTKNLSTIDLVAERFYLQQPKPPCDQIVPATFCNRRGADNCNNRSNYDTSNRFGTNTLWGSLFKKKTRATQNFNMAAIFQDGRHGVSLNVNFCLQNGS